MIAPTAALAALSEKDWDSQLFGAKIGLATTLGWGSYHTLRSRGSAPGYPDRTLWRDRVVFAELKAEGKKPTERQRVVLDGLARAGGEVYLWRPSDLDEIGTILSKRWSFDGGLFFDSGYGTRGSAWTPGSLWIPGAGRADAVLA